jgi:uncharacterized membrane protein YqjE
MSGSGPDTTEPGADVPGVKSTAAVIAETVRLLLQHWALARAELADSRANLGLAVLLVVAALLTAVFGMVLLLTGVALGIAIFMPAWAAFLSVCAATVLLAGILLLWARTCSRRFSLIPRRAVASLQKDAAELARRS